MLWGLVSPRHQQQWYWLWKKHILWSKFQQPMIKNFFLYDSIMQRVRVMRHFGSPPCGTRLRRLNYQMLLLGLPRLESIGLEFIWHGLKSYRCTQQRLGGTQPTARDSRVGAEHAASSHQPQGRIKGKFRPKSVSKKQHFQLHSWFNFELESADKTAGMKSLVWPQKIWPIDEARASATTRIFWSNFPSQFLHHLLNSYHIQMSSHITNIHIL